MKNNKEEALDCIYSFFINSLDFNGIPLRQISHGLGITYEESIDIDSVFYESSYHILDNISYSLST